MDTENSIMPTAPVEDEDTFNILISSDNHLGVYDNNNNSERGKLQKPMSYIVMS